MVRIKFFRNKEGYTGFELSGHAGYAAQGRDIVCAAVSSAVYLAVNTLTDSFGVKAQSQVEDGYLSFTLQEESQAAQRIIGGLNSHLRQLAGEYPRSIKVIYGGNTNA